LNEELSNDLYIENYNKERLFKIYLDEE